MVVEPDELIGTWRLARRIRDRPVDGSAARFGRVDGTLTLAAASDGVEWFEAGTLEWGGQALTVTRRLHVRRDGLHQWVVCFDGDRPFHPWRPGEVVEHRCGEDTYRGLLVVDAAGSRLRIVWDVSGPAKDSRMFSRCTREARARTVEIELEVGRPGRR